jgi:soluble lytic murein transglycosylase-like protein
MKHIVCLVILMFFYFSLPNPTEARVYAYIDGKGELYYTHNTDSDFHRLANKSGIFSKAHVFVDRSAIPIKTWVPKNNDSISMLINGYIKESATKHGIDPLLVKAIIKAESNFDAKAISTKGAQGLMQLMPATAKEFKIADPFDPMENIAGGTKYLRSLLDNYNGDVELSLAAYNAGPGNVRGSIPNIYETKTYVSKVLGNYRSYRKNK